MRRLLTALMMMWASTVSAYQLPDGGFLVSTTIFDTTKATPRYVHLQVSGGEIDATFIAFYLPDYSTCQQARMCFGIWQGLHLSPDANGIYRAERKRTDAISTVSMFPDLGYTDDDLYIRPLERFLNKLTYGDTRISRLSLPNALRLRAMVLALDVSVNDMAGCEIAQMSLIERIGGYAPLDDALDVFNYIAILNYRKAQLETALQMLGVDSWTANQMGQLYGRPATAVRVAMALRGEAHDQGNPVEEPYNGIFADSPFTFEEVIAPVADQLDGAARYLREFERMMENQVFIADALCNDITLGL
ncbi:hypothetical protein BVC71_06775 [Marivivens niveibacter]|uniref:Uncharacterized protein n=1 Tax=Marivivens niveibacter TaxID=1930667 RepID=A0A251WZI9_9RHOB|nr:hypothetical protein [Marivivens niveibacter]OUD09548.1 hypothetical protein BVC71_06775 [Marivivens niveibacter]